MNICLKISYLGTNYCGFQKQKNANTIQGVIENNLEKLFNEKINIIGCSRTDAGVHAKEFYCNFYLDNFKIPFSNIKNALNSYLPFDIRILDCFQVPNEFHSRYNALKKMYVYKIYNGEIMSPFNYFNHMHFKYYLDFNSMEKASKYFVGTYDFKGFSTKGSSVKTTIRTIFESNLIKENNIITYKVLGDGFLYNMVRIIIGTLIMVGQNKIHYMDLPNIINSKERGKAGFVSEAKGLCLEKIYYDN